MITIQKASVHEAERDDKGAIAWSDVISYPTYEGVLVQFIKLLNDEEEHPNNHFYRLHTVDKIINL